MINSILGIKLGMIQIFKDGSAIPVSVIKSEPCRIIEKKVFDKDGYSGVKLGFIEIEEKKVNKPQLGYFKKQGISPFKYLREVRVDKIDDINTDSIGPEIFEVGEYVNVTGISKGKGFQGIMKRYGAAGGPGSHGSMHHRAPGSIGASSDPSRVFKGTIMPGRMGGERVTVKNLEIIRIEKDKNILLVRGAVPGSKNGLLIIRKTGKKKKIVVVKSVPATRAKEKKPAKQQPAQKQEAKK